MRTRILSVFFKYGIWCLVFFVGTLAARAASAADAMQEAENARMEYICALASISSYHDDLNLFTRAALTDNGFEFIPLQSDDADEAENAKMFLVKKYNPLTEENLYILTVTGTEDFKDVKTDLKINRVPFPAGRTSDNVPKVHRGFYDALDKLFLNAPQDKFDGLTVNEFLRQKLLAAPFSKLYLTGHSLGGAVATLAAASLSDAGVPADKLEVISFGAPAVGDQAFADFYEGKFGLKRIVMTRDPVESVLQSVKDSYVQQNPPLKRKKEAYGSYMNHAMAVYLDAAIRNYCDIREKTGIKSTPPPAAITAKTYIAPLTFNLDVALAADEKYMRRTLQDTFALRIKDPYFAKAAKKENFGDYLANAKKLGADYLIVTEVFGNTLRNNRLTCRIVMEETVYSAKDGTLISMQSVSTLTEHLTPIEAVLYLHEKCRRERETALRGKEF